MKTTTTRREPDTLDHLLALAWAAGTVIVRDLLLPLLALVITLATLHREPTLPRLEKPTETTAAPAAPLALPPATLPALEQARTDWKAELEGRTVAELRQLARAAGHKALARSGRRQQLLEVLA